MIYKSHPKKYVLKILFYLTGLVLSVFLTAYFLFSRTDYIGIFAGTFLTFSFVFNLFIAYTKNENDLIQFLENIIHNDFSATPKNASLAVPQQRIMKKFQQMATERSVQSEHLNLVVEHIDTALLCFDERNAVKIANNAAKTLLKTKFVPSLAKISTINPQLAAQITKIKSGEQLVQNCTIEKDQLQLIISASEFKLLDKSYKLVSLKDVKRELDEKEIESWRKLIRVINHEIINSMTPIVSLSGYMNRFLHNGEKLKRLVDNTSKEFGLLSRSIETINMRSQGLVDFINAYRGLIQHPQKNFSNIDINAFFQRIGLLLESKLGEQNIQFETVLAKPDMLLRADEASLEQIIINLIYNAVEALEGIEPARITLESNINREGKIIIQVHDNGKGIQEQFMENIFTPFFSTKERNSGVGLSISKQLAQLNKASLSVQSVENEGSTFTLSFSQDGQTPTIL